MSVLSGKSLHRSKKAIQGISRFLSWLAALALAATTILIVTSSLLRYVVGKPIHFTEEVGALLFFSACILSLSHSFTINKHIRISILLDQLPKTKANILEILAILASLVFLFFFIKESWVYTAETYEFKSVSPDANIRLWGWMALMPLGTAIFFVNMLIKLVDIILDLVGKRTEVT